MEVERYAVVDVETTGFSPTREHVVEIGCVLVDGEAVVYRWEMLVHPGIAIPEHATVIHGLTDGIVAAAPDLGAARSRASSEVTTCLIDCSSSTKNRRRGGIQTLR